MGASISVERARRNMEDSFAVEEKRKQFQNAIIQTSVDYCRHNLFTESPMIAIKAGERTMILKVDDSRLEEMTNPTIGRIGAPFLVTLNIYTGNMLVQLFPDRKPTAPLPSQSTSDHPNGVEISATPSPRTPNSPFRNPSSPLPPLSSPSNQTTPSPVSSPATRSRLRRRSLSRQTSAPSTPKKHIKQVPSTSKKRIIFGAALMSPTDVPLPPSTPRMVEQSPNHITVEWCAPINDGGLVEKYEIEYRRSHRDIASKEPTSESVKSLYEQHVIRNPSKFGWKKLRTLYWYEWNYRPFEEKSEEEDELAFQSLFNKQQEREMKVKRKELYAGLYPEDFEDSDSETDHIDTRPDNEENGEENGDEEVNQQVNHPSQAGGNGGNNGGAYGLRADLTSLKPATCFEFRVRACNHYGFSEYSEISLPIQSSPTPPGIPLPPFAVHTSGDSFWLSWLHPELNGLPLEVFELSWHIPGEASLSDQRGSNSSQSVNTTNNAPNISSVILNCTSSKGSSYFLKNLKTRTTYSLTLRAKNAAGWSAYSSPVTMTTTRYASDVTSLDRSAPSLGQQNWWVERYDARSRTAFLFNILTGERQNHGTTQISRQNSINQGTSQGMLSPIITDSQQLGGLVDDRRGDYSHSMLFSETDELNVNTDEQDIFFQTAGPELDFMKKRRKLHRKLLLNMRATSSSASTSIVTSTLPVDNRNIAENENATTAGEGGDNVATVPAVQTDTSKYLWMKTNRNAVLSSMIARFSSWDVKLLKMKRIKVAYEGEDGIDSGGLGKDFFASVAKALVHTKNNNKNEGNFGSNDKYFTPTPSGGGVEIISGGGGSSGAWRAIGRFVGKAIIDRQLVPGLNLCRPLMKQLLGQPVNLDDLIGVDDALYKSLHWTLNHSIEGILDENFTIQSSSGEEMELCEGGKNISLTDTNKSKYVDLRVSWYFQFKHFEELDSFVSGFVDLVPPQLLAPFDFSELERLLVGTSEVDVDDIRAFTVYGGEFTCIDATVLWFWEYWKAYKDKGKLLDFVTASTRVPLDGFDPPFCIISGGGNEELPRSHTCFNQLVLPKYDTYELMAQKLDLALDHASEGFFAS